MIDLPAIKKRCEADPTAVFIGDEVLLLLEALEEARRLFTEYGNHHSSCILEHHAPGVRDCGCGYIVALRTILGESE